MSEASSLHLIVIVGCQRSGTTLLGQVLGAREDSLVIDEEDGLYEWFDSLIGKGQLRRNVADPIFELASRKYIRPDSVVEGEGSNKRLGQRVRYLVLKAPNLTYRFRELGGLRSDVSIVYPVRDPRPVVASMKRLSKTDMVGNQQRLLSAFPEITDSFADSWNVLCDEDQPIWRRRCMIWRIKSHLQDRFRGQGLTVAELRYEDLIGDTVGCLRELSDRLAVSWDARMLRHEAVFRGRGPGGTLRSRPIDSDSSSRWREDLSANEVCGIEKELKVEMSRYGYL